MDDFKCECVSLLLLLVSLCREKFKCMLTNVKGDYFCSVKIANPPDDDYPDLLDDLDEFEIKLCHNKKDGSENCELLNNAYRPQDNSKEHIVLISTSLTISRHSTYSYIPFFLKTCLWCMFVFNVSSHQLNQTHRAASQLTTTQVNGASPGRVPMSNIVLSPLWAIAWTISSSSSREETKTK